MDNEDLEILRDSINNDNLVERLDKMKVFVVSLSDNIVNQKNPNDTSKSLLERAAVEKKVYDEAFRLFKLIKEDEVDKEEAEKCLIEFSKVYKEFKDL